MTGGSAADVGYGKAEVAIARGRVKAIRRRRQVAVRVPTHRLDERIPHRSREDGRSFRSAARPLAIPHEGRAAGGARRHGGGQVELVDGHNRLIQADVRFTIWGCRPTKSSGSESKPKDCAEEDSLEIDVLTTSAPSPIPRRCISHCWGIRESRTADAAADRWRSRQRRQPLR